MVILHYNYMKEQVTPYKSAQGKKEQVEEMFDNIAPTYDKLNRVLSMRVDTLWRKNVIKLLKKAPHDSILDIATGTCDLPIAINKSLDCKQLVGLDLSEEMLAYGQKKLNDNNIADQVKLIKGDSENLPFDDNSFDAITCSFGVRNFENLLAGLSEMRRVVKENGQVIILEFSTPQNIIFRNLYYFYFFNVLPFVGNLFSGDKRAYSYLPESVKAFPSGNDFADKLKQAGFKTVLCKPQTIGICTIYQAKN